MNGEFLLLTYHNLVQVNLLIPGTIKSKRYKYFRVSSCHFKPGFVDLNRFKLLECQKHIFLLAKTFHKLIYLHYKN